MLQTRIGRRGQITLPREVRRRSGREPGRRRAGAERKSVSTAASMAPCAAEQSTQSRARRDPMSVFDPLDPRSHRVMLSRLP